jgi:serine/threonine-protein kinase
MPELERLHLEAPPPHPSAQAPVPPALDLLVVRTLSKDPAQRPQSAREFLSELAALVAPPKSAAQRSEGRGLGVYLEVHLRPGAAEDDEALAALGTLLDLAEAELRRAGLAIYLATGSALLAVAPLGDVLHANELRGAARGAVGRIDEAGALHAQRIGLRARIREDDAALEEIGGRAQVKGGPLVQVGSWPSDPAEMVR